MANISSINGNQIIVGSSGIADGAVTGPKVANGSISLRSIGSDISALGVYAAGTILLESGTFADGTLNKTANPARFRCVDPIYMRHMHSITAPDGYEMWVYETDKDGAFIKENRWRKTFTKAMCSESTVYALIVLRDPSAPNTDISSRLDDVQDAITFVLESDTIATATQQMESATNEFDRPKGLAYADVGSKIVFTTSGWYRYVRVEKDDDIDAILFRIGGNSISAYVRYVDDNDIVLSMDVTSSQINYGVYKLNTEVLYKPLWPSGATALYLISNGYTAAGEGTQFGVLELYRKVGNMEPDAFAASLADMRHEIELARMVDYDSVCRSICRLGMSFETVPQQSTYAYIEAYKAGFRSMLCDLRFTSDGVPVLWHDGYLNELYNVVYKDGSLVPKSPAVYIASTSYSDLLQYDFGVYRGSEFEGTRILTLDAMLDLCKKLGCEVYIEEKLNPTQEQFDTVFGLIDKYNMRKQVVWCPQSTQQLDTLTAYEPDVFICFMTNLQDGAQLGQSAVDKLVEKRNDFNRDRLSISVQKNGVLTGSVAESIAQNSIGLMGGTLESKEQVLAYYNRGYPYTMMTEVLSSGIVAGKVLFNTILS